MVLIINFLVLFLLDMPLGGDQLLTLMMTLKLKTKTNEEFLRKNLNNRSLYFIGKLFLMSFKKQAWIIPGCYQIGIKKNYQ